MTKSLTGFFMSQLVHKLSMLNAGNLTPAELSAQLVELLADPNALVDLSDAVSSEDSLDLQRFPLQRLGMMDESSRAILNTLLPWSSYNVVDKKALGGAYLPLKRALPHRIPDKSFKEISNLITPDSHLLEIGCFEGHYTTTLAMHCRHVYAFDSRIENVLKTLVRTWALGMDKKISVDLLDIERNDVAAYYQGQGIDSFDLIYHRGVLYHLSDPVGHLANLAPLTKAIYLNTQYADDSQAKDVINTEYGQFYVYSYNEPVAKAFAPFAGMNAQVAWLRKSDMLSLLGQLGFTSIDVTADVEERNGKRITLIAKK